MMSSSLTIWNSISWVFGLLLLTVGVLNVMWVHPVPGIMYFLLALLYFPPLTDLLKDKTGISVPGILKVLLGIVLVFFSLGVSDLGDMIDKW
ncbi:hypothetical protein [Rufibacter sp. LB8]|uniref:hypothetical protein n=2 Tax=Rufibacter sp. LB8 TaxID=2777781 RepID=UPI00178C6E1C|nr:hypothetical protein [Rufibacter sp. LB8]